MYSVTGEKYNKSTFISVFELESFGFVRGVLFQRAIDWADMTSSRVCVCAHVNSTPAFYILSESLASMSSDGFFQEEDIDQSFLKELDAIEASSHQPPKLQPPKAPPLTRNDTFDYFDETFDVDDSELMRLDNFIENAYRGKAAPVACPSNPGRTNSKGMVQTTLFGGVLPEASSKTKGPPSFSRSLQRTTSKKKAFGQQAPKTKVWDQTAFAKTGWRKGPKGNGKGKAFDDREQDDWDDEEPEEFEQFPAPFVSVGPPPPMRLEPDLLEARHWFYPLNQPKRDYQFNIVKHSLFENTLVALPTGLGKTFISGVVMLNCAFAQLSTDRRLT